MKDMQVGSITQRDGLTVVLIATNLDEVSLLSEKLEKQLSDLMQTIDEINNFKVKVECK